MTSVEKFALSQVTSSALATGMAANDATAANIASLFVVFIF
jgi:hypothetical protein